MFVEISEAEAHFHYDDWRTYADEPWEIEDEDVAKLKIYLIPQLGPVEFALVEAMNKVVERDLLAVKVTFMLESDVSVPKMQIRFHSIGYQILDLNYDPKSGKCLVSKYIPLQDEAEG